MNEVERAISDLCDEAMRLSDQVAQLKAEVERLKTEALILDRIPPPGDLPPCPKAWAPSAPFPRSDMVQEMEDARDNSEKDST